MTTRAQCVLVVISTISIVALAAMMLYYDPMNQYFIAHSDRREAVYDHFSFSGFPNFVRVSVSNLEEAHLYVEVPDGQRFLLKDIPEEIASRYMPEKIDFRHNPVRPMERTSYKSSFSTLSYRNGKLHLAYFQFPKDTFRFSPRLEGPYLELPADKDQLIQIFGEPLRWKRPGHIGPQF